MNDALANYTTKVDEYRTAVRSCAGSKTQFKPVVDYSDDMNEVEDLNLKLATIAIKHKDIDESITKNSNSSSDRANSNMVKLQKMSCPKFSGSPRDFGQFKREFLPLFFRKSTKFQKFSGLCEID